MEVSGRISVEPQENWLSMRLKSVSTEDLKKELGKVKDDQREHIYHNNIFSINYYVKIKKNNKTKKNY